MVAEGIPRALEFITTQPARATLDIGSHLLTGYFLVQRYFPEASKVKKGLLSFFSGLSPDFDFFAGSFIPHRTATHSFWYSAMMGFDANSCNLEDYRRIGNVRNILEGTVDNLKRIVTSRYAKLASIGAVLHLTADTLDTNIEKLGYATLITAMTYAQNRVNASREQFHNL